MKYQGDFRRLLFPKPDIKIHRTNNPHILDLESAVAWIKEKKPLLWIGSIFSVPSPSRFPSGLSMSHSILDMIFHSDLNINESERSILYQEILLRWPLEAIFDLFEILNYDLSDSLLSFLAAQNRSAMPNMLHNAVVKYYQKGYSSSTICITTNWDTLIEKAFRLKNYIVNMAGIQEMPSKYFGKSTNYKNDISIYHPHGCFELNDVICSRFKQQQQLTLYLDWRSYPILFLGYSGYEPSLYRHLEYDGPQLWCIRDMKDLEIPSKRRLLCRDNVYIFVGDLIELLSALGVLERKIAIEDYYLSSNNEISKDVLLDVYITMAASVDPLFCTRAIADMLFNSNGHDVLTQKIFLITNAIDNHIRDRNATPELVLGLIGLSNFIKNKEIWTSLIAYLLRTFDSLNPKMLDFVFQLASSKVNMDNNFTNIDHFIEFLIRQRIKSYKRFLGRDKDRISESDREKLSMITGITLGDLPLMAEMTELEAFFSLKSNNVERAERYFDTASTYYYLAGLWNAGENIEWASKNIDRVMKFANRNSLRIDMNKAL